MRKVRLALSGVVAIALAGVAQAAPYSYTGGTYSQNFDGLPNSGAFSPSGHGPFDMTAAPFNSTNMTGWSMYQVSGTGTNMDFHVVNGSESGAAGRGGASYGTTGSGDRAFGGLATSADQPAIGAVFTNNTGAAIDSITISFTGEQWRRGDAGTHDTLVFAYGLASSINASLANNSNLDFASPNVSDVAGTVDIALNGNDSANQTAVSYTLSGLGWADTATLAIRWTTTDNSGSDDGLGIDNLSLVAVPEPASLGLIALGGLAIARRRRS